MYKSIKMKVQKFKPEFISNASLLEISRVTEKWSDVPYTRRWKMVPRPYFDYLNIFLFQISK